MATAAVRTRFAPSPTGQLHLGNAHTALFAWLFARHAGGSFVLRFEDTDLERLVPGAEAAILGDLRWLGLDWDEGPDVGGAYGPYRQSERGAHYARAAERLREAGQAYYCFCTAEELAEQRQGQLSRGEPPRYDGRCRHLSEAETERRARDLAAAGGRPALRFRLPEGDRELVVADLVHGPTLFHTRDLDDFMLVRPNGTPLYNFAVTVDDWTMAITHVIRGEEHLPNTPRQLLIFAALGVEPPAFAHLPMLMGPGHRKLSKREQATSLAELREEGYLAEALLNYLALLGWSHPAGLEVLPRHELIGEFNLERVGRSGAVVAPERLNWLNREYLKRLPEGELWRRLRPFLSPSAAEEPGKRAVEVLGKEAATLKGLAAALAPFVDEEPPQPEPEAARWLAGEETERVLASARAALDALPAEEWQPSALDRLLHRLPAELGLRPGRVFRPLRAALTGLASGPELPMVAWLLGKERALRRLDPSFAHGYNQAKGEDRAE